MKCKFKIILLTIVTSVFFKGTMFSQNQVMINVNNLQGTDLNIDNLFSFQVQSNLKNAEMMTFIGSLKFNNSDVSLNYTFKAKIQPGINVISKELISPRITYSSASFKELFEYHKKLPEGLYEYCVSANVGDIPTEIGIEKFEDCLIQKSDDIFLIELIDPINNAQIYEYNPMLSWTINYPFSSEIEYKIKVTDIKSGQNTQNAIQRNNAIFTDKNLKPTSIIYPVYAKPLLKNSSYAWTVEAFYKGIYIGSAVPWKFTIIEDSLFKTNYITQSYVDIKKENGNYNIYAPGELKLKYQLDDLKTDTLNIKFFDNKENEISSNKIQPLIAKYGDNRFDINLYDNLSLKHLQYYNAVLYSNTGNHYRIRFQYLNPDLLN